MQSPIAFGPDLCSTITHNNWDTIPKDRLDRLLSVLKATPREQHWDAVLREEPPLAAELIARTGTAPVKAIAFAVVATARACALYAKLPSEALQFKHDLGIPWGSAAVLLISGEMQKIADHLGGMGEILSFLEKDDDPMVDSEVAGELDNKGPASLVSNLMRVCTLHEVIERLNPDSSGAVKWEAAPKELRDQWWMGWLETMRNVCIHFTYGSGVGRMFSTARTQEPTPEEVDAELKRVREELGVLWGSMKKLISYEDCVMAGKMNSSELLGNRHPVGKA